MAGVSNVNKHIADEGGSLIVVGLVLNGEADPGHELCDGAKALQGEVHLAWHDVQGEEDVLQDRSGDADQAGGEHGPVLCEEVAHVLVGPTMKQMHEGQEDADPCVHIIRPPLVLDLSVHFEVLRRRALCSKRHHALEGLALIDCYLFAVPSRHVSAMTSALLSICVDVHALVVVVTGSPAVLVPQEWDSKHLPQRLLLP